MKGIGKKRDQDCASRGALRGALRFQISNFRSQKRSVFILTPDFCLLSPFASAAPRLSGCWRSLPGAAPAACPGLTSVAPPGHSPDRSTNRISINRCDISVHFAALQSVDSKDSFDQTDPIDSKDSIDPTDPVDSNDSLSFNRDSRCLVCKARRRGSVPVRVSGCRRRSAFPSAARTV